MKNDAPFNAKMLKITKSLTWASEQDSNRRVEISQKE